MIRRQPTRIAPATWLKIKNQNYSQPEALRFGDATEAPAG
jgi:hypothetical protein